MPQWPRPAERKHHLGTRSERKQSEGYGLPYQLWGASKDPEQLTPTMGWVVRGLGQNQSVVRERVIERHSSLLTASRSPSVIPEVVAMFEPRNSPGKHQPLQTVSQSP
jgi:hypothetical protein